MAITENAPTPTRRLLKVEVPIELHRSLKILAASRSSSMRAIVENALERELDGEKRK